MASDSISSRPLPASSKDFGKKKRTNRLAKLKQCKLDVRREQWLSQVKNNGCKLDTNGTGDSLETTLETAQKQKNSLDNLETRAKAEDNKGVSTHGNVLETCPNVLDGSSLIHDDLTSDLGVSSSNNDGCCSENAGKLDEDDGCLDDWEAVADALNVVYKQHGPILHPPAKCENGVTLGDCGQTNKNSGEDLLNKESRGMVSESEMNCRAWMPDDASRPQSLPKLSKQHSFSVNAKCNCSHGAISWTWQRVISQPCSCPICYEDLDITDSSFLPCPCGFRLCLFCHKRILEADGRCPGCRKQYALMNRDTGFISGPTSFQVAHSCIMSARS